MSNLTDKRIYPTELVNKFTETNKSFIRINSEIFNRNGAINLMSSNDSTPIFLSEATNIRAGQEYSVFEINKLNFDASQSVFTLDSDISFPNKCIEISLYADLIDTSSNRVVSSFSHKAVSSQSNLTYDINQHIAVDTSTENFAVIVYADWKTTEHSKHSAAIFSYIYKDVSFECDLLYPKKEESYIKFPQNSKSILQSPPNVPALMAEITRKEYIQIALFRMPDDHKDLDYLCEFGSNSSGQPFMCVPTSLDLILHSSTTQFCKPVKAYCTISSLDPAAGGKYIIASGESGKITESDIEINVKSNTVHIEMISPWKVPFPYGNCLRPYDFSYEVIVELSTITENEPIPFHHTIYAISSIKEDGMCLAKIPHISIRWGCLDENTLIRMADGSYHKIKDIKIGDIVRCRDCNKTVENVWRGLEDKFFILTTKCGKALSASADHPVLTKNGWKRIENITVDDILISEENELAVQCITVKNENTSVCNLSLSDSNNPQPIIANGIFVGDMDIQNERLPCDRED